MYEYSDSDSDLDADSVQNIREKCLNLPRDQQLAKYAKLCVCVDERLRKLL